MPTRPPAACPAPGCRQARPCPDHPTRWAEGLRGRDMPPGWPATRARILRRDPVCTGCHAAPSAEVHHLLGPGHEADHELAGMCAPCHLRETLAQAAAARAAAHGERSPSAPAAPGSPVAQGDGHRLRRPLACDDATAGVGGDPRRGAPGGAVPVPARSAAGFGLFWSPEVTGTAVVPGQRPGRVPEPGAAGDRLAAVTLRVRSPGASGHPWRPVALCVRSPGAAGRRG